MTELEQLKDLLVGTECQVLDGLQARLDDPARRSRDIAEVLPEAILLEARNGDRLAGALQEPVARCIRTSIERDTKAYADALFPVMGPAIRRAIGETLKTFVQSINQAVEHSVSVQGLRWRWEAVRSCESFAAVVLKHTLVYRVEAAYLIHNESGLLIGHAVAATHTTLKDEDAVSAMLTAIEDFVQDAFSGVGEGGLESVEVGERTLWLVKGSTASLACVVSGMPPTVLRDRLQVQDQKLRTGLQVRVVGRSDGIGRKPWNRWLRQRRADFVRDALATRGVPASILIVDVDETFSPSRVPVPELRRVDFSVSATAPSLPPCLP